VRLKAENLQRTGSFKLRGALNKVRSVPEGCAGVVAGSAGNHAQALAYAARAAGLRCEVFMPVDASVSKVSSVRAFGAVVHQEGRSVDECVALARSFGASHGLAFVHPFDDLSVISGQGGLGLELLDDVVTVDEDAIAEAMVLLVERSKLVVEGAGAAALAALLSGAVPAAPAGSTVAVLSGGNVDVGLLARIASRHETRMGRRLRVYTRVSDLPGGLAGLLAAVADVGANLIDVEHVRDGVDLGVRETGIELTVETRGRDHAERLLTRLREAGYDPAEVGG
jgi:threonine dehydratase